MNISNQNSLSGLLSSEWEELIIEKKVDFFNNNLERLEKIKIQIKFTQDHQIIYYKDGAILRVEYFHSRKNPDIFNNMEQIQNLSWQGQYNQKKKKDGKWIAFWDGNILKDVFGYYKNGQKQGLWKYLFKNYRKKDQIFETGEYLNDFRIGKWNYLYNNENIGGGLYNFKGEKIGNWIVLDEGFFYFAQVTYHGEYNMKGVKVGKWDISYCDCGQNKYKIIGGGSYGQEQIKIGRWVELLEGFNRDFLITYNGVYNMKGMKIGRWDICYKQYDEHEDGNEEAEYELMQILQNYCGGGSYDQGVGDIKIGRWVELLKGFNRDAQVTYNGEYNFKGMKIGRWDIWLDWEGNRQIIGGSYRYEEDQIKIGKWVELDEKFYWNNPVTYNGEYNMKGMKIGTWVTMDVREGYEYTRKEIKYDS
ncbi:unnamed protein product [Paramecium sonneborni]|uniref:MORN repeat protein n=1 Tax=Paramecium sonneborni TaxID=65129 RepID=A0A8S1PUU7_9CILI|nr:unnamed protein product [Paramecium sonneborni]